MIRPLQAAFAATVFLCVAPLSGTAQTLTNLNGTAYAPIYTSAPGRTLGGVDSDDSGNLYFLESGTSGTVNTRLYQRASNGTVTELFNFANYGFSTTPFASFVRVQGNQIYWAESSTGTLWNATLGASGSSLLNPTQIGQIAGNYDLAFGANGAAYLSANPGGFTPSNRVYRLTLGGAPITLENGALPKLDASSDYSGPVVFDAAGNLVYATTGYTSAPGGFFRYTSAELAGPTELTLDLPHLVQATGGSAGLAFNADGTSLFSLEGGTALVSYFYGNFQREVLGTANGYFGAVTSIAGDVVAAVNGFSTDSSAALYRVVPEPTTGALLVLGLALGGFRRRARSH